MQPRTLAAVAALLLASRATAQSPWSTTRATLSSGAAPTATNIQLVRGIATLNGTSFRDGTIDVELAAPNARGTQFAGIAFRVATAADYEIVYFSASDDGLRWSSIQYQPVYEGETTWQLYPGDGYKVPLPLRGDARLAAPPMHVRLTVSGKRADVYVNDMTSPALRVHELKRDIRDGGVGVWAVSPDSTSTSFASFRVRSSLDAPLSHSVPTPTPTGQIMQWRLSPKAPSPDGVNTPRELTTQLRRMLDDGRVISAEASGLVNLTRELGNPAGRQDVNVFGGARFGMALASVQITSEREQVTRLRFGYSDGIAVFLNGRSLFNGRNDYHARYQGYLGTLSPEADGLDLPLRAGRNELVLVVTDKAFGWGFSARLEDLAGLSIAP